ncbi:signal peptidase I [Pseudonocardia acidicola]|uniref:Signal peptidase I n=1 Tax=Pseudonocardia acidicola TaxID=2724939 RepID=A0ABX1SDS7_9PSEU|nr:signal peptidase I [Pseudonocardia acidicola]NMH99730.1 signal peptidase I [Pseudonocardia acidicola]
MSVEPETGRIPAVRVAGPRPHPVRRVGRWIAALVLVAMVAAAGAVAVVPAVTGAAALTVLSGSMEPALPVGSTVVIRPRPVAEIGVGDVITFTDRDRQSGDTRIVTHRVIEVQPGPAFRTKGDANNAPDPNPVAAADVHGVEWYDVPFVGLVKDRLFSRVGLFFAIGLALLVVAAGLLLPGSAAPAERTDARRRPPRSAHRR